MCELLLPHPHIYDLFLYRNRTLPELISFQVWDLESGQKIQNIKLHPEPYAVACSFVTGDELIVFCCQNFKIFFFNLKTKQTEHVWDAEDNYGGLLDVLCMPGMQV